jgi:hypothetical protein
MESEEKAGFPANAQRRDSGNYKLTNKNLSPSNAEIKSKENEIEPD